MSSLISGVEDNESMMEDQNNEEQHEQNNQSEISGQRFIWSFQEPHHSGLGNLTNPHNSCFAAVALQLFVASEVDLHLVEGIYYKKIIYMYNDPQVLM